MTGPTLRVLTSLMSSAEELSGAQIGRMAELPSGTLYPVLMRLEDAGWLASRWEDGDPATLGRPRRRYYRITGPGQTRMRAELRALQSPHLNPTFPRADAGREDDSAPDPAP